MGEDVRPIAAAPEQNLTELPGVPEVFAAGVIIRGWDSEMVEIVYTVTRRPSGPEAVLRVWMPRGAFEAARERYKGVGGPRH